MFTAPGTGGIAPFGFCTVTVAVPGLAVAAYYVYLARKLQRFRLVGIPLFHLAEQWCYGDLYRRMLAQCEAVVANTEFEAQFVEQRAGIRAVAAGVGFQSELFEQRNGRKMRERYGLGSYDVVGFVGRQAHNKGVATLIRAMRKVWTIGPDVRLLIAGPRPPADRELDPLMSTLTDFERQHIIFINGFSDEEKPSIYDTMDVFVLPSTGESFGIAYLEAWMCGKPVVGRELVPRSVSSRKVWTGRRYRCLILT